MQEQIKNRLMFPPMLPASGLRELAHHNYCSRCLVGKAASLPLHRTHGGLPLRGHCIAGPTGCCPLFQSRGENVPFSMLVSNFHLGSRDQNLRVLLGNSSFSSESNFSSLCVTKPILELFCRIT